MLVKRQGGPHALVVLAHLPDHRVLCAWLCASLAGNKGYSPVLFGILGFFFFLIT